jgi:hypothetical protein
MTDTEALVMLVLWLAAVTALALGCALLILQMALEDRPAGQLRVREILVPLWCLLAGAAQEDRLQAILGRRLTARQLASTSIRDVARHRAEKQLYQPRHEGPKHPRRTWIAELDDDFLLDRGNPLYWVMMSGRWPPYL